MAKKKTCQICCEDRGLREFTKCSGCDREACKECMLRACLTVNRPPSCLFPKCNTVFSLKKIYKMGKKYKEQIIEHYKNISFDRLRIDSLDYLQGLEAEYRAKGMRVIRDMMYDQNRAFVRTIARNMRLFRRRSVPVYEFDRTLDFVADSLVGLSEVSHSEKQRTKYRMTYIMCPADKCNGIVSLSVEAETPADILDTSSKSSTPNTSRCSVCDRDVCVRCGEMLKLKTDIHKCDPNTVKSLKAIMTSCRPCPKCNMPIYRTEGCSQMFCTSPECVSSGPLTGFDFRTGRILNRDSMHNPHMIETITRLGRSAPAPAPVLDLVDLGSEPYPMDLELFEIAGNGSVRPTVQLNRFPAKYRQMAVQIHAFINDTAFEEKIQRLETRDEYSYRDLIMFYLNEIRDEDDIKKRLFDSLRKRQRSESLREIVRETKALARAVMDRLYQRHLRVSDTIETVTFEIKSAFDILRDGLMAANEALVSAYTDAGYSKSSAKKFFIPEYLYEYRNIYWG